MVCLEIISKINEISHTSSILLADIISLSLSKQLFQALWLEPFLSVVPFGVADEVETIQKTRNFTQWVFHP
jgi:hypothetical protein